MEITFGTKGLKKWSAAIKFNREDFDLN